MPWTVEVTEEFETWWNALDEDERISIDGMIRVLEAHGTSLGSPFSSEVADSRHGRLRTLFVPHQTREICVMYSADDASQNVVLLWGAMPDAASSETCPPEAIARAESIYDRYLERGIGPMH